MAKGKRVIREGRGKGGVETTFLVSPQIIEREREEAILISLSPLLSIMIWLIITSAMEAVTIKRSKMHETLEKNGQNLREESGSLCVKRKGVAVSGRNDISPSGMATGARRRGICTNVRKDLWPAPH